MNDKNELRKSVRAEIAALTENYISESNAGIYKNVTALPEFAQAGKLMLYFSVGREPDTLAIARAAFAAGKLVAFPFCYRGGIMQARVVSSLDELSPSMLGIPAPADSARILPPEDLDLIIVPALAYDRSGFRLGYGGGYYDRYLKGLPAFTVGIARERLVRGAVPREPHDIAVNCLVTEKNAARLPK